GHPAVAPGWPRPGDPPQRGLTGWISWTWPDRVRFVTHNVCNDVEIVVAQAQLRARSENARVCRLYALAVDECAVGAVEIVDQPGRLDPAQLGVVARHTLVVDGNLVVRGPPDAHHAHGRLQRKAQTVA